MEEKDEVIVAIKEEYEKIIKDLKEEHQNAIKEQEKKHISQIRALMMGQREETISNTDNIDENYSVEDENNEDELYKRLRKKFGLKEIK